jgi:hypothetical protein
VGPPLLDESAARKSCAARKFSQNSGELPQYRPSRRAVSAVTPRLLFTMSFTRVVGHESLATTRESSFQWHAEFLPQHFARVNWPQSIPDHARSFNGSRPFPRPKDRHFASGSRFTQRRPRRAPLLFSIHCRVTHSHYGVAAIASRTSGTGTADGRGERNGLTKLGWIDRRRERCARGTARRGVHQLVQNGEVLGALLASSLYTAVIGCAPRASAEVALGSPAVISRWVDKRAFPPRSVSTY